MQRSGMRRPSNKCENAVSRRLLPPYGRMRACCILAPVVAVQFPEAFTSGRTRVQTETVRYCGEAVAGDTGSGSDVLCDSCGRWLVAPAAAQRPANFCRDQLRDKRQGERKRGRGMAGARGIFASRRPWRVSGPAEADSGTTGLGSTANSNRLQCKQRRQA